MRSVKIYRTKRVRDMYVYVDYTEDLDRVPEALLKRTGELVEAMVLDLDDGVKLARAETDQVLAAIEDNGFYLQMPPPLPQPTR